MHSIDSRFVIGPSNILFASLYVCTFQPRYLKGWGSEGVKNEFAAMYTLPKSDGWTAE